MRATQQGAGRPTVATPAEPPGSTGPNVLLIDDQPARLLVYESILEGVGVQCVRALSGRAALDCLLHQSFAVIILDVSMPEMDGFETARLIRDHPRYQHIPIIFVTGVHVTELDALRGYEVGAIDYITVPIVPEILRSKVALLVELHRRRVELERLNRELEHTRAQLEAEHNKQLVDGEARLLSAEQQVQQLLQENQARNEWLSAVLNAITEEVHFTDTHGRYTYANRAARREFGPESGEGIEVRKILEALEVRRPNGSLQPIEEAPALRALAGEVIEHEEQIVRLPTTGQTRHRLVSSAPVRDSHGQIIGSVSVARDITEQKRIESSLREADHRKNVFLATLSHELRNPLAPIRTAARLLESPSLSPAERERARSIIARQVAQMASLLDDLLDISRLSGGKLTLKKARVPLAQIIDAALETAGPQITAKRHRVQLDIPASPVQLEIDPVRMTQVLTNLLINAAQYTHPNGLIKLRCALDHDGPVISVSDTGVGLSDEIQRQLREASGRAAPDCWQTEGGLGIGLFLARALVELHGGRLEAHCAGPAQGSTFAVRLPATALIASDDDVEVRASRGVAAAESLRVLVADDNADGVEALALLLRQAGYQVFVACDGEQAWELAQRLRPNVALLDIGMPGLNGYEVAARIRAQPWGVATALFALTGWGQDEDKQQARAAGFDRHLVKPVEPAVLESMLASLVDSGGVPR
jgi:PAS domain S-box-containing protein